MGEGAPLLDPTTVAQALLTAPETLLPWTHSLRRATITDAADAAAAADAATAAKPADRQLHGRVSISGEMSAGGAADIGEPVGGWVYSYGGGDGSAIVFDDSFEHEVYHRGSADRFVVLVVLQHPSVGQ